MNERIKLLADKAIEDMPGAWNIPDEFCKKFAQLIVQECMAIARNREDELESANLLRESRAVGIVVYRMARQFGVKE